MAVGKSAGPGRLAKGVREATSPALDGVPGSEVSTMRVFGSGGRVLAVCAAVAGVMAVPLGAWWLAERPAAEGVSAPPAARATTEAEEQPATTVEGWRWESYGGVEVQVPADWGYGTTGTPPCLQTSESTQPESTQPDSTQTDDERAKPYVGRPGAVAAIGCPEPVADLARRGPYLWFGDSRPAGQRRYDGGWVEETRVVGGVTITVLSDDAATRERILRSARPIGETDSYGCAPEHSAAASAEARPSSDAGGLSGLGDVTSVTVCRYARETARSAPASLLSASRIEGEAARRIVDALTAAPVGTGPNAPGDCAAGYELGDEVMVLQAEGASGARQEVVVRYSGCDRHGTDDGVTTRQLTATVLRNLLTGPHSPSSLHERVGRMVWSDQSPAELR
jgi:hypothetical protein